MKKQILNLNDIKCVKNREVTDADIESMAVSIGNTMLLSPLLLKEYKKGKYEVAAGRTRYFALMKLERYELATDDYRIINSEDAELISFIENFERRQLSLLEEAEQIGELMKHHDVSELATILGRSEKYVRFRAQINKLIPAWKEALINDEYPQLYAGHYEVISRFPESVQKHIKKHYYIHKQTVKEFTESLDKEYSRLLVNAPFDAAKCMDCPKCSNRDPWLFEELKDYSDCACLDPECWHKKIAAFVKQEVKDLQKNKMRYMGGDDKITLVCNEYLYNEKPPYTGAVGRHDYEMLEVLAFGIGNPNAFIVSGENAGQYCRIRLNNKPGTEPQKPVTPEDKELRAEGRRIKQSIVKLYDKIQSSKFERPDDGTLISLAGRIFVNGASVDKLSEKKEPEDIRNDIWKSVVGNISAQLHCHAHSPLVTIDAAYGKTACDILGLSWDEFTATDTE